MQLPSLTSLKAELKHLSESDLIALVADLSKFSRENKAFLYFKLNEKENPRLFIEMVQEELEKEFQLANTKHYHVAKKSAQAIRRKLNKFLKLNKNKSDQIEVIEYFCRSMISYSYLEFHHPVIDNLYAAQIRKIETLVSSLHEDLQYDYEQSIKELKKFIRF